MKTKDVVAILSIILLMAGICWSLEEKLDNPLDWINFASPPKFALDYDQVIYYLKATESKTFVQFAMFIEPDTLAFRDVDGNKVYDLVVAYKVFDDQGMVVQENLEKRELSYTKKQFKKLKGEKIKLCFGFPIEPGEYILRTAIKSYLSKDQAAKESKLNVPAFDDKSLCMSPVILAEELEKVSSKSEDDPFIKGNYHIVPRIGNKYKLGDTLKLFYEIYNLTPNPETKKYDFYVEYSYWVGRVNKWTKNKLKIQGDKPTQIYEVELEESPLFKPDKYKLKIEVTDQMANDAKIEQIVEFEIVQ